MVFVILGALLLLFVQTLIAPSIQYLGGSRSAASKLRTALGPRDSPPDRPIAAKRADRALKNLFESLPIFLTLAILSIILQVHHQAAWGATVFLIARVLYVPAYVSGAPGIRSLIWAAGLVGLVAMLMAILPVAALI